VSKKRETGINATVWARALSTDPEKVRAIQERANVLIVDEVSMLTEQQKKRFFELYGDMKIIMCGDLGYQLPCIDGEEMKPTGFDNIVKHTTDFRCRDARLKEIKNELRQMIEYDRPRDEIKFGNEAGASYVNQACKKDLRNKDGSPREMHLPRGHFDKELHLGEGGCGKTHMNCNDGGLVRPLFVAP
jgi:hypothetical protein